MGKVYTVFVKKNFFDRLDFFNLIILFIVSLIIVIDLFSHSGRHITFDGHIHMTTMAQFATALKDGEFPVVWSNNFANYGLPLPLFSHQLPAYLGAFLILLGLSVVTAYNLLIFSSIFLSAILFYIFSRKYADQAVSLVTTLIMSLFPYKIINVYIRGGLPELLAGVFFPLILLGVYQLNVAKKFNGFVILLITTCLLALTHPMMLIVYGVPGLIYYLMSFKDKPLIKDFLKTLTTVFLGLLVASFYLLPLMFEMKYFYQGNAVAKINNDSFFSLENFITEKWPYFFTHPGPRGNFLLLGLPELAILVLALVLLVRELFKQKFTNLKAFFKKNKDFLGWIIITVVAIFFLTPSSKIIYQYFPGFAQLQYAWRFLAVLQHSVPLLALFIFKNTPRINRRFILIAVTTLIFLIRVPQLYGKNYAMYSDDRFYFTQANLHSQNLNTIWSGSAESYPKKATQAEIIEGDGKLIELELKNSSRKYQVVANSPVKLVDYTFYFPGWQVIANDLAVEIEFQDPEHRGLISYNLPPGDHLVLVEYKNTKIRKISLTTSILAVFASTVWLIYLKKFDDRVQLLK